MSRNSRKLVELSAPDAAPDHCASEFADRRLRQKSARTLKRTFWPMIGGIGEGFPNYLLVLRRVDHERFSKRQLTAWLAERFGLADSYATKVVTTLFTGADTLSIRDGLCVLSEKGRALLDSASPRHLYRMFSEQFAGIAEIPAILSTFQPLKWEQLFDKWYASVEGVAKSWKLDHANMQFRHRLDWLRALTIVEKVSDSFFLSRAGLEELARERISVGRTPAERQTLSHSDIEDKLKLIGEFFEFMSIKRASVNDARPPGTPRLGENRQLDCLWARVVHFGGRVQYAFEVQLGGNVSDAIERLEMVANFVQKAVVVTDPEQEQRIRDRLEVKHSLLRDKLLFLSYQDVNNVAAAVNALKIFTGKVFHE